MHVNNSIAVKTVGRISLCSGGKFEECEIYNYFFVKFYVLIRIEIDRLLR